ncbi:MAG: hypothetical protein K2H47_03125 [Muribaculaceae bacterium]|nr:hypothetical protein [Muribaculaceae bacterium]
MKQGSFSTPDELYNSGNMVLFSDVYNHLWLYHYELCTWLGIRGVEMIRALASCGDLASVSWRRALADVNSVWPALSL